ncbi:MAG: cytochrome c oxidase subunit II [Anaerolineae bacterium]|nr:cytochrome c oxidase subunit II [Anaerolineae bacterium]
MKRYTLWIGLALLLLALPAQALAHGPSDGGADKGKIDDLFMIIGVMAMFVFVFVEGLILRVIWTRKRGDEEPEQDEGNHILEISWTLISLAIIAVIFVFTYRFMNTEYAAEAQNETGIPDLTVHVEGYMFDWDYEYFRGEGEPTGVKTTTTLTVPTDRLILLEITSRDVQHSFWVSELAGKVDAVPGYTNTMWLNIDKPGTYQGNCAEFCGEAHSEMIIELVAVKPAEFEMWLSQKRAAAGQFVPVGTDLAIQLPTGDAERGARLFNGEEAINENTFGCANCHGTAPSPAGPSLAQIRQHMNAHEGYTAAEYLHESIVLPCAYEAEGFSCKAMQSSQFHEKLNAQGLADIIAYLLANGE